MVMSTPFLPSKSRQRRWNCALSFAMFPCVLLPFSFFDLLGLLPLASRLSPPRCPSVHDKKVVHSIDFSVSLSGFPGSCHIFVFLPPHGKRPEKGIGDLVGSCFVGLWPMHDQSSTKPLQILISYIWNVLCHQFNLSIDWIKLINGSFDSMSEPQL